MAIWAIADLHLSFGVPNKKMDIFGPKWAEHEKKIERHWREMVSQEDLVLIPGDISWGMRPEEAEPDLKWIDNLPGTKVLLRGNHDYWWSSLSKIKPVLPTSCHLIQNNSFRWKDVSIAGSRMWDSSEYSFGSVIDLSTMSPEKQKQLMEEVDHSEEREKIFRREVGRLEMSLRTLDQNATTRIAMVHYPPIGLDLKDSEISKLLEKYKIDICVFGHLHEANWK